MRTMHRMCVRTPSSQGLGKFLFLRVYGRWADSRFARAAGPSQPRPSSQWKLSTRRSPGPRLLGPGLSIRVSLRLTLLRVGPSVTVLRGSVIASTWPSAFGCWKMGNDAGTGGAAAIEPRAEAEQPKDGTAQIVPIEPARQ
jgi:hypothetical protein